jgi:hypothetical protein
MPTPSLILVPARFKSGKLYTQVATTTGGVVLGASGDFNVTRATPATRVNANGLIESVASGVPRLDYYTSGGTAGCPAFLIENEATNLALHSRDLANAVWSGTTVMTEKNAVGADGVASGATTITATDASGTVLQALSHASQSRVFSAFIRRVTGTGAIQLTTNGGTNWDTVTITNNYTQVASVARTVASGTVGIRLAASGDVIEVDFTQGELALPTSPIATTSGTVTRNADVVNLSGAVSGCIGQTQGTIYVEVELTRFGVARLVFHVNIGNTSQYFQLAQAANNAFQVLLANTSGNSTIITTSAFNTPGVYKIAFGYQSGNYALYVNGNSVGTSNNTTNFPTSSLTRLILSDTILGSLRDRIRSAAIYNKRLPNDQLQALTTL